jgi:hypothetical protein
MFLKPFLRNKIDPIAFLKCTGGWVWDDHPPPFFSPNTLHILNYTFSGQKCLYSIPIMLTIPQKSKRTRNNPSLKKSKRTRNNPSLKIALLTCNPSLKIALLTWYIPTEEGKF